jgi:hypothetical protein
MTAPRPAGAGGYEWTTLEQEVLTAMAKGDMITVTPADGRTGQGVPALSGAALAYAVLCPPAARIGPA